MTTVNRLNTAISAVRGMPHATSEAYSRDLRRAGIFPETSRGGPKSAPRITTTMAGYMLAALLRGSPTAAAENAREVGDLIVHDPIGNVAGILRGEDRADPILDCQRAMFGWPADMSFARAVGWLIDRYVDGSIANFIDDAKGIMVEVDRYWVMAKLFVHPAAHLVDGNKSAWQTALGVSDVPAPLPMEIMFHSPLRYEMKVNYKVNPDLNRAAHQTYSRLRDEASKFDRLGTESVTQRTLIAIAEVFK